MRAPPDFAIEHAIAVAKNSPCAKTRRGAVVFTTPRHRSTNPEFANRGWLAGSGFNGPPAPLACDGSASCRADCGKRCVHAEARAVRNLIGSVHRDRPSDCELVHVKIDSDGKLDAGGGPSCWQCSREILDAGIAAVWLYRLPTVAEANAADVFRADDPRHVLLARWQRYTAEEFHRITCANAKGGSVYVGGER